MTPAATPLTSTVLGPEIGLVPDDDPYRLEFRRWLGDNSPGLPEPLNLDERFAMQRKWQRVLFDGGWAGPAWPEQYGGRGAGPLQQFIYYEELAIARAPVEVNPPGIRLVGPTLMVHGTEEQKARFLPPILSGEEIHSQAFSEPNAGSDLASLRTRAALEDDEWVINGQKIWTSWAQYSDFMFVLCRTEPGSERHRGLSLLICPTDQPDAITIRPITQISGDSEFSEVFLDGARTQESYVLGGRGNGWTASMTLFQFERADQGFTDHGRLLVRLADIAADLRAGQAAKRLSPATVVDMRQTLADLWIRAQQLRRFNLRVAVNGEAGQPVGFFGSVVNLFWGELEKDTADLGARVLGAGGLALDTEASHHLLSARQGSIHSGTSEIQRNIIAERILGLPR